MGSAISPPATTARLSRVRSLAALYIALAAALILVLLWSITAGRYHVPFGTVLTIIAAHVVDVKTVWTPTEAVVVEAVRLPRVLTATVAGAGLALCGAVLQAIFRNPL